MKFIKSYKYVVVSLLSLLVISGTVLWLMFRFAPEAPDDKNSNSSSMLEFKDSQIGVQLKYPAAWGEVTADHFAAFNGTGQVLGPFYRWRFKNEPNVYMFSPPRGGLIAVQPANGNKTYSGYSFDFVKRGSEYCLYYTNSAYQATCPKQSDERHVVSAKDYTYNGIKSLIRHFYSNRDRAGNLEVFGKQSLFGSSASTIRMQEVELLNVIDKTAEYPSVTIEILGHEDADMSHYLNQLRDVAKTISRSR